MTHLSIKLILRRNILYFNNQYTMLLTFSHSSNTSLSLSLSLSQSIILLDDVCRCIRRLLLQNSSYNADTLHCLVQFLFDGQHHPSCCHHFWSQSSLLVVNQPATSSTCSSLPTTATPPPIFDYTQLLYLTGL